jgi:hypothetical protein
MLELLEEVYTALHNNASRLALVGTRTLVDLLILERVGDVGTFKEKLKRLVEAGVLTGQGSDVLYAALDAGSAVAHRGLKPEPEVVTAVIEIIENVLQAAYHLGGVAKHLRLATPPRPSKR